MGQLASNISPEPGCPSGLQDAPVLQSDPLAGDIDLSGYVDQKGERAHLELLVQGAHCAGCVSKIETGLRSLPGVTQARMNLSTSRLSIDWLSKDINVRTIVQKLTTLGFGATPYAVNESEKQHKDHLRFLLKCMALAGFVTMNVMLLSISVWSGGAEMSAATRNLFHTISAVITVPAILYSGRPFFGSAWAAVKRRTTNMDVPISLAIVLATGLSLYETAKGYPDTYFDAAIMLVFLLLIGRYLDARMRARTGDAARRLAAMQITSATRILPDGRLETLPARDIEIGDTLLVPIGQRIALDGIVVEGQSQIDMQIVTGESVPQNISIGEPVYAGTINLTAPLKIEVQAEHQNSFLSEITRLVEAGEQSKGAFVRIADRAARAYVPVVHSIAILTLIGWLIVSGDVRQAIICAIAVLIITCPCALGLAVPAVNVVTIGELYKRGVLVKSGDVLERLSQVDVAIFDKTGTLTKGQPKLMNSHEIDPQSLAQAAALARFSAHPLSRALAPFDTGIEVSSVLETPGGGVAGKIHDLDVLIGSADFAGAEQIDDNNMQTWFRAGQKTPVKLVFQDAIRSEAGSVIAEMGELGLKSQMISGDRRAITEKVAKAVGIADFKSGVSPSEKLELVQAEAKSQHRPLMIGDGVNDAPALAGAWASVSLSSASDVSRDSADVILQHDGLSALPDALRFARRSQMRIKENLGLAVIYNALAVPLAIFGFVTPLIAAVAMSGSSLIVTLNALRMRTS